MIVVIKYDTKKYLPCALLSNFIYDFCYTAEPIFPGQSSKYDGIIYPSVKDQNRTMLNVAFTQRFVNDHVVLKYVVKGVIDDDLMSVKMQEIGFYNGKEIVWYTLTIPKDSIRITKCLYYDDKGNVCDVDKGHLYDKNHDEVKNYHIAFRADIDSWFGQMLKIISSVIGNFDDIEAESAFPKTINDWSVFRELDGWTLEIEDVIINMTKVKYVFNYQLTLEKLSMTKKVLC